MRTLKILAAAHLLITGVLIWRVCALEDTLDSFKASAPVVADGLVTVTQSFPPAFSSSLPGEDVLRQIIHEEMISAQSLKSGAQVNVRPAPELAYSKEFEAQFNTVTGKLDSVIGSGAIDESAMEKLHVEIGQLHPRDRRIVLSRLAKAINTGTVKLAR